MTPTPQPDPHLSQLLHLATQPTHTNRTAAHTTGLPAALIYTRLTTDPQFRDHWNRARTHAHTERHP